MTHHQGQLPLKSDDDDGHPEERSKGGMKKIKPRRKKDPNAPKRPLSGYNIFFRDKRCAMKANPDDAEVHMGFEAIVKTVSREWQRMDEEARAKYEALSKVDHTRYLEEMQEYTRKRSLLEAGQDGGGGGGPSRSLNNESEEGTRRGEKKSKLLGVAKRPLSGYNIFFREEYARIKASMAVDGSDGDSTINMSAEISKRWAGLDGQAKKEVNRKAAQLQAETEAAAFEERREGMGSSSVGFVHCHGSPLPSGVFDNGSGGGEECQVATNWPPSAMAQEMYYPAYIPTARDIALQHIPSSSSFSSSSSSFQHDGLSSSLVFSPSSLVPLSLPPPSMATTARDGIRCASSNSGWLLATQLQQLRQQQHQQHQQQHQQQQGSTQLHMSNLHHQEHYQRQWQQQAAQLLNPLAPTHRGFIDHNRSSISQQQQQQQVLSRLPVLQPIALIPLDQTSQMQPQQPPQYTTQEGVP